MLGFVPTRPSLSVIKQGAVIVPLADGSEIELNVSSIVTNVHGEDIFKHSKITLELESTNNVIEDIKNIHGILQQLDSRFNVDAGTFVNSLTEIYPEYDSSSSGLESFLNYWEGFTDIIPGIKFCIPREVDSRNPINMGIEITFYVPYIFKEVNILNLIDKRYISTIIVKMFSEFKEDTDTVDMAINLMKLPVNERRSMNAIINKELLESILEGRKRRSKQLVFDHTSIKQ